MSEQGRQPEHQSEMLDHRDYHANEQQALRALAKLSLLNDAKHPLSLIQVLELARQTQETYARWEQSKAPINTIEIRLSNSVESPLVRLQGRRSKVRFNGSLPTGKSLDICRAADEEFGEVLLFKLSLSEVTPDGSTVEKSYANGQILSLHVKRRPSGEFSISVEVTEPSGELNMSAVADERDRRGSMVRFHSLLSKSWKSRVAAYALAVLTLMSSLSFLVLRNIGVTTRPQLVRLEVSTAAEAPRRPDLAPSGPEDYPQLSPSAAESPPSRRMPAPRPRPRIVERDYHRAVIPAFTAVSLRPVELLRTEAQIPHKVTRVLKPKARVRFTLTLPEDVGPGRYTISLTRMGGEKLLTTQHNNTSDRVLRVSVPAPILTAGSYALRVSGPVGPPAEYWFTVVESDEPGRKGDIEARPADDMPVPKPASEPSEI